MSGELVSVVVATYNRAYCLPRTLDSVLQQTHECIELLVVDDGSTDNTRELIETKYADEPRIRYLYQENQGVSAARNHGIRSATGQYVALIDSDDVWKPWKIELQLAALAMAPEAGMVWTDMEAINPDEEVISPAYLQTMYGAYQWFERDDLFSTSHPIEQVAPHFGDTLAGRRLYVGDIFSQMIMGNLVHTSTVLIRRERMEKVKGFNEGLRVTGEDYDFHLRTCREGPVAYLDVSSILYQVGMPDQLTRPSYEAQMAQNFLRTIEPVIERDRERIELPEWMIRHVLASANSWVGRALFDNGDHAAARRYLLRSLKYEQRQPRLLAFLALTIVPPIFVRGMRQIYRKLK